MVEKSKRITNPFIPRESEFAAQDNFDKEYVTLEHKQVVKKTGEGEDDFVLVIKHIVHKEPIDEVLARDSGTCSIQAIMEQVLRTKDPSLLPEPLPKDGVVNDITAVPDNLMDLDNMQKDMAKKFEALPDELKKGRTFAQFCEGISQDEFNAFIALLISKGKKVDEKKDGDK